MQLTFHAITDSESIAKTGPESIAKSIAKHDRPQTRVVESFSKKGRAGIGFGSKQRQRAGL